MDYTLWLLLLWPVSGLIGAAVGVIQYSRRGDKTLSAIIGQLFIGSIFGILFGPLLLAMSIVEIASLRDRQGPKATGQPPEPYAANAERNTPEEKCALCAEKIPKGQEVMVEIRSETQSSRQAFHPECARVYQSTSVWPKLAFYWKILLLPVLLVIHLSIKNYWPK